VTKKKVLILGGGAAGINAALYEAAAGNSVYLAEPSPGIGGERIPQTRIITDGESFAGPDLTSVKNNKNIEILKSAEVQGLTRENRHYRVNLRCGTTRVDPEKCNECGECIKVCPIHMYDDYNAGLEWRTAIDSFGSASGDYNIFREDMPVCQRNCPINLDIRTYVGHIADRHYDKALATIRKKLPFALSIGRVCPHPCEDMCNRGDKDEPVSICALKRFAADHGVKNNIVPKLQLPAENYPEKIAIVGGGPSGLTCAYHLALLGYENVTVFEALSRAGGMFLVGIPEYRLPKEILAQDIEFIMRHGVEIRTGVRVGQDISFDQMRHDYNAILLAVGAHKAMPMRVKNEKAEGVLEGVSFLRDVALGHDVPNRGKAIVVGGGNVAMDVARTCVRNGFEEVNLLYRRTRKEMPASPWEVDAAEEEGVRFHFLVSPQAVVVKNEKAVGLKCHKMSLGEPDASGRRRPVPIEGSEFVLFSHWPGD